MFIKVFQKLLLKSTKTHKYYPKINILNKINLYLTFLKKPCQKNRQKKLSQTTNRSIESKKL